MGIRAKHDLDTDRPDRQRFGPQQAPHRSWTQTLLVRIRAHQDQLRTCLDRSWTDRRHIGHTQEDPPTDEEGEWAAEDSEGEDDETNSEEEEEVEEGDEDAQVSESSPTR